MHIPTSEQFSSYLDHCSTFTPEEHKTHPVYVWLTSHTEYKNAVKTLNTINRDSFLFPPTEENLAFMTIIAFESYFLDLKEPKRLKVLSQANKEKALNSIKKLIGHMSDGLHMMDEKKSGLLLKLLKELESEIIRGAPSKYPSSMKGHVANKMLAHRLGSFMDRTFKMSPKAVHSLMLMVVDIEERQVHRYLKDYREYEIEKDTYIRGLKT